MHCTGQLPQQVATEGFPMLLFWKIGGCLSGEVSLQKSVAPTRIDFENPIVKDEQTVGLRPSEEFAEHVTPSCERG